ncbi:MAG: hypothetical protein DRQ46_10100, partial [Gammaproteobacteria bacterium]
MATFEATRSQYVQQHFEVFEIDLPVVEGVCTVSGVDGYGTPLSCDQSFNATRTYKFTNIDAPLLPDSGIWRQITRIGESSTEIKPIVGLAARGTLTVSLQDFKGDPNPDAPAVNEQVENQGTFLAKLRARQILENKPCRIKLYRVEEDGTIDLVNGAEIRYFVIDAIATDGNDNWTFRCKDELAYININEASFPLHTGGFVREPLTDNETNNIAIDGIVNYQNNDVILMGDEFIKISNVSNIGTGTAT